MNYRLFVVDLDGTLIQKDGTVSAPDRDALFRLREEGVAVAIATGRATAACKALLQRLNLSGYHIFYDGALVADPSTGKAIYAQPLPVGILKEMIDFAHAHGIYLELYSQDYLFVEFLDWPSSIHRHFFGVESIVVPFESVYRHESILKGEMVISNATENEEATLLRRYLDGRLKFSIARAPAYPGIDFVNIVNPNVSKGDALQALIRHLDISRSEVVAIGDGLNDISLFETAGLAIAMGNAPEELKKMSNFITSSVDENGVAGAIEWLLA